jgi:hypothetical protein
MRSKLFAPALVLILLAVVTAGPARSAKPARKPASQVETAVFAVPNLSDETVVKNLTGALAKEKGVAAARADTAAGKFLVTFMPGKTGPAALTRIVTKVAAEARFEGVQAADGKAAGDGCGKCPSRSSCGNKK